VRCHGRQWYAEVKSEDGKGQSGKGSSASAFPVLYFISLTTALFKEAGEVVWNNADGQDIDWESARESGDAPFGPEDDGDNTHDGDKAR
jgi:hypothetical protein